MGAVFCITFPLLSALMKKMMPEHGMKVHVYRHQGLTCFYPTYASTVCSCALSILSIELKV